MAKQAPIKHIKLDSGQIALIEERMFACVEKQLPDSFYLLGVTVLKEGPYWLVQVFIERSQASAVSSANSASSEGVSLQDCEQASRLLSQPLEVLDVALAKEFPVLKDWSYSLEVSSPGLFRPLLSEREFLFYQNRPILIRQLAQPETPLPPSKLQKLVLSYLQIAEGQLQRYDHSTRTVYLLQADHKEAAVVLKPGYEVLLNPVLHLEDEDSLCVTAT